MGLIDADSLYDALGNKLTWLMGYGDEVYLTVGNDIRNTIDNQPTAYDIDKVVEELCKEANETIVDFCSGCFVNVDRAIEIVKQGVAEDCRKTKYGKWIFDKFTARYGNPYRCSCCNEEFGDTYNHCPNCGVSMKEVE